MRIDMSRSDSKSKIPSRKEIHEMVANTHRLEQIRHERKLKDAESGRLSLTYIHEKFEEANGIYNEKISPKVDVKNKSSGYIKSSVEDNLQYDNFQQDHELEVMDPYNNKSKINNICEFSIIDEDVKKATEQKQVIKIRYKDKEVKVYLETAGVETVDQLIILLREKLPEIKWKKTTEGITAEFKGNELTKDNYIYTELASGAFGSKNLLEVPETLMQYKLKDPEIKKGGRELKNGIEKLRKKLSRFKKLSESKQKNYEELSKYIKKLKDSGKSNAEYLSNGEQAQVRDLLNKIIHCEEDGLSGKSLEHRKNAPYISGAYAILSDTRLLTLNDLVEFQQEMEEDNKKFVDNNGNNLQSLDHILEAVENIEKKINNKETVTIDEVLKIEDDIASGIDQNSLEAYDKDFKKDISISVLSLIERYNTKENKNSPKYKIEDLYTNLKAFQEYVIEHNVSVPSSFRNTINKLIKDLDLLIKDLENININFLDEDVCKYFFARLADKHNLATDMQDLVAFINMSKSDAKLYKALKGTHVIGNQQGSINILAKAVQDYYSMVNEDGEVNLGLKDDKGTPALSKDSSRIVSIDSKAVKVIHSNTFDANGIHSTISDDFDKARIHVDLDENQIFEYLDKMIKFYNDACKSQKYYFGNIADREMQANILDPDDPSSPIKMPGVSAKLLQPIEINMGGQTMKYYEGPLHNVSSSLKYNLMILLRDLRDILQNLNNGDQRIIKEEKNGTLSTISKNDIKVLMNENPRLLIDTINKLQSSANEVSKVEHDIDEAVIKNQAQQQKTMDKYNVYFMKLQAEEEEMLNMYQEIEKTEEEAEALINNLVASLNIDDNSNK